MNKEVIIIGAGGHGKVIADIIMKSGDKVYGFLDDGVCSDKIIGFPFLGKTEECRKYIGKEFIIAIGNNYIRKNIADKYSFLNFYTAVHPSAVIAVDTEIGCGSCVMANAVINTSAKIGRHCIINSASVIEHDNTIDDYVHISPGAILMGTVSVGTLTHIGGGTAVRNNLTIGSEVVIGVGAAVVTNIEKKGIYAGVPAKEQK